MKTLSIIISFFIIAQIYGPSVKWLTNLNEAFKLAKEQRKSVLAFYYIDNDADSKSMMKILMEDKDVSENTKNFICAKINSTNDKRNFNKYPVIQFFSPSGKECLMQRLIGLIENWEINNTLNMVLAKTTDISNAKFDKPVTLLKKSFKTGEAINIRYNVLERGYCVIKIFNQEGNLVKTLLKGVKKADKYSLEWNQLDKDNKLITKGNYIIVFELGSYKDVIEVNIQ